MSETKNNVGKRKATMIYDAERPWRKDFTIEIAHPALPRHSFEFYRGRTGVMTNDGVIGKVFSWNEKNGEDSTASFCIEGGETRTEKVKDLTLLSNDYYDHYLRVHNTKIDKFFDVCNDGVV